MQNAVAADETPDDPVPQGKNQDAAYSKGIATGCLGCLSAVVFTSLGFVGGYSLVVIAHEREWFYTQEEFKNHHGLSDFGLAAFGNALKGGLVGAVGLPVAVAVIYGLFLSYSTRAHSKVPRTERDSPTS